MHLNKLNKGKNTNNKCGIKNIYYHNSKKKWCFKVTLNDRKFERQIYNTKLEALFALKYLIDQIANEDEKQFICLDTNENFDEISDVTKEIIKNDINIYIDRINSNIFKQLKIKSDKT